MRVSRRGFLGTSAAAAAATRAFAANDNIQVALIGAGGMGQGDARTSSSIPGVKLVAACDIYTSRLERCKELWGAGLFTTRDYREILARPDVDAVLIATPDHWHARIAIDALNAGKDVYCQKPMVHELSEGKPMIDAQTKTGKILQIGSQYASSLVYEKARDLIAKGAIGEVNMVEAWLDRNTAVGAWQYTIPPDATPETIDWDRFLGKAPKRPFEPIRLFRWRNYRDYGTGVAGDLFVHLLTGLHVVTGSIGPTRVYSTGGLRFWTDGRDVPDINLALMDYPKSVTHPEFTLALRVNFASGGESESFGFRFVGSEGVMTTGFNTIKLARHPREKQPGLTLGTFPKDIQEQILTEYRAKYPYEPVTPESLRPDTDETFTIQQDAHRKHHENFYAAVRSRQPFFEDGVFGFRAAGPSLLSNVSYFEQRICNWDPKTMSAKDM
jgi:predicted dehydrogenase